MDQAALDSHPSTAAPKLPLFSRLANARAASIIAAAVAAAALVGGHAWEDRSLARMSEWQSDGVSEKLFTGTAKLEASRFDIRGDFARISPGEEPTIVAELGMSGLGQALDLTRFEPDKAMARKMTFMHERGHVEYQTAMPERFDAPGLSSQDRVRFSGTFAKNDAGQYQHLRSRLHGAMHERFAEAYGALGLAMEAAHDPVQKSRVDSFLARRVESRTIDAFGTAKADFAHKLGLDVEAALQASRTKDFDTLAPNQLKAVALRIASLSYLADAHSDGTLRPLIEVNLQGAASKALWKSVPSLTGSQIADRALSNLPAPAIEFSDAAPIASNKFASNAKLTSAQIGVDAAPMPKRRR